MLRQAEVDGVGVVAPVLRQRARRGDGARHVRRRSTFVSSWTGEDVLVIRRVAPLVPRRAHRVGLGEQSFRRAEERDLGVADLCSTQLRRVALLLRREPRLERAAERLDVAGRRRGGEVHSWRFLLTYRGAGRVVKFADECCHATLWCLQMVASVARYVFTRCSAKLAV